MREVAWSQGFSTKDTALNLEAIWTFYSEEESQSAKRKNLPELGYRDGVVYTQQDSQGIFQEQNCFSSSETRAACVQTPVVVQERNHGAGNPCLYHHDTTKGIKQDSSETI